MANEYLIKENHLNGCFGKLFRGGSVQDNTAYLRCECNTSNVSSDPNEEHCNHCPFMNKKIKLVNYPVQVAGFGFSGVEELGSRLKEEL